LGAVGTTERQRADQATLLGNALHVRHIASPLLDGEHLEGDPMEGTAPSGPVTSITVNLTPTEFEALRQLAAERGSSNELVLREALLEKKFFADHRRAGQQVVLRHPDGKLSPVNWAY
jgi:hypothetical protein